MAEITGTVFDIKKFAIHDGPGIRTTVFLKGCPLNCLWCHNPESKQKQAEISFISEKCIMCGYCAAICPNQCHVIAGKTHSYDRSKCLRCGKCTLECYAKALEIIGKEMTVKEVIDEVLKDVPFYETSGGGMTISGGEPMAQFEFTKALLAEAKKHQLHNCLETSGFAPMKRYKEILNDVDTFLIDCKESDPARHLEYTGVPRGKIINNIKSLDKLGANIVLRCPIIPGLNDREDHFRGIAKFADPLSNINEINILPYHPLGKSKSDRIGKEYSVKADEFPADKIVESWLRSVQELTKVPVRKG